MPRLYTVSFELQPVSVPQDLFQVSGAAGRTLRVLRATIGVGTPAPVAQMLAWRTRFLPATVTNGSGGVSVTPSRLDPGDSAASFAALANSTTEATSSGTPVVLDEGSFHVYQGLDERFGDGYDRSVPIVGPGEAFVLQLLSVPIGSPALSGTIWVEETGG